MANGYSSYTPTGSNELTTYVTRTNLYTEGKEYALRKIDDTKQHIYDATKTKMGRPGNPVGEIITKNQKREKIVMYRKKK